MKRIMLVDDEKPVLDGIKLMIRRDLSAEFEVVGTASSGREAIEKVTSLVPDIILMDVSMPGIPGLDAIREIRKRGINPVFILVTAYERFDIAREAIELGVVDYLLKPVARDTLTATLRAAALASDEKGQMTQREYEFREREEKLRAFVETAFLHGIMLGESRDKSLLAWKSALNLGSESGLVFCVAFLAPPGQGQADREIRELHEKFRTALHFKMPALVGPLVLGRCLCLVWLRDPGTAEREIAIFRQAVNQSLSDQLTLGLVRVGCGSVQPLEALSQSWYAALADLTHTENVAVEADFNVDSAFIDHLVSGSPDQARLELDRLLVPLEASNVLENWQRFRILSLLGTACRHLTQRGLLDPQLLGHFLNLENLYSAADPLEFCLLVRTWLGELLDSVGSVPLWSAPVAKTIAWIRENFGAALSLETAAELTGLSVSRLSRLFVAETGQGFSEYLISWRIERAKEMLRQAGASIKAVSMSCGYSDPNYFARLFKKETGSTPSAYAAEHQEVQHDR